MEIQIMLDKLIVEHGQHIFGALPILAVLAIALGSCLAPRLRTTLGRRGSIWLLASVTAISLVAFVASFIQIWAAAGIFSFLILATCSGAIVIPGALMS